jgi:hypothetical protein
MGRDERRAKNPVVARGRGFTMRTSLSTPGADVTSVSVLGPAEPGGGVPVRGRVVRRRGDEARDRRDRS